jgi:VWFA-related protein
LQPPGLQYNESIRKAEGNYLSRVRPLVLSVFLMMSSAAWLMAQYNVHDQEPPRSSVPPQNQPAQDQQDDSVQTFKAQVNVVNLFFNVKDKHGLLIPGLTKDDFEVLEDGKPQTVKYFAADSDQPLTLGILIDTSPSQTRVLTIEQEDGSQFLQNVLRQKDLAFLINFDSDIDLDQDYTNNARSLKRALDKLQIGGGSAGGGPVGLGGGPVPNSHPRSTALYDAIYLAADEKLKNEVGRKAMIVFTDGEDEGSRLKIRDAIEAAQKADTVCYVILIADRGGWYQGFGLGDMKKLAEETGGRVIDVGNNQQKLRQAFDQIQQELRSQYNIGYTPSNTKLDGSYRKIQIKPKNGDYKAQARQGYYAQASRE